MTKSEIVKKIMRLEREEKRREKLNPLNFYNVEPFIHKKQLMFHKCLKKNRWVFGGNRSGKSECGAVECVYMAKGVHPYRENRKDICGWVVSLSSQVQRDTTQQKIMKYLSPLDIEDVVMSSGKKGDAKNGIIDYILVKNVFGGVSKIGFKTCDQGREKFQGASLDFVWFDEEPPKDIYDECKMRVMDRDGDIFGTMTPLKGLTFIYDEIYLNDRNDEDVWYISMEWADNPFLSKKVINSLSNTMSEDELESRRYGKFKSDNGIVYKEFDERVHVIEPFDVPKDWYDNISIDPGLNNPLSCHFYAVDNDGVVYVIAEHYESGKDVIYHAEAIKNIAKRLDWHFDSRGRLNALIDSASNQRTLASLKSVAELFYDNGIVVNTNVNKDLFSGINRVKSYLKPANDKPKLYIFSNCVNLIREIKGYYWGQNDVPKKKDDHSLDELRYYIMSKPCGRQVEVEKNIIQRDKEKLIRKIRQVR